MISLKASSIGRSLELALLLALMAGALWASPYSVAVLAEDEGYRTLVLDALSALSGPVTNAEAAGENRIRLESKARFEREGSLSGYRRGEDSEKLEKLLSETPSVPYDGISMLEVADVTFTDTEKEYLLKADPEALSYARIKYGLDAIITASVQDEGQVSFSELWVNGKRCYSSAYLGTAEEMEFDGILHALLPYIKGPGWAVVHVDAPGRVAISVDGRPVSPVRRSLVLEEGEHVFRYTSYSFEAFEETVYVEDGAVLSPRLEPVFSGAAFLSSVPYDARLYYQGELVEDHLTENGTVPFAVTAAREGFSSMLYQGTKPSDSMLLELNPEWTEGSGYLERTKRNFYNSLLATLLSFGCYVGSVSLEAIFPSDTNLSTAAIAFTGLSLLQLVELADSMFSYYQAARLGL